MRRGVAASVALALLLLGSVHVAPAQATRTTGSDPLDEVLAAAAANARCGLTRDKLAAIMLAPTFPETGSPSTRAPSPMTLSRYDNQSALYSFGNTSNYVEAFWHPGVGQWQFDEAGGWGMTAAERIDARSAALRAADVMASRWCTNPSLSYVWAPWFGCGTSTCLSIYNDIFDGSKLRNLNEETVGRLGGMVARTCVVLTSDVQVPCSYVDPARAEGYDGFAKPIFGPSPVTKPFYSYELDGEEQRHWMQADTGYGIPITAHLPQGLNSRTSLEWESSTLLCDLTASRGICDPIPIQSASLKILQVVGTYQPLTGDFDGDGNDDVLWYGAGAAPDSVWFGTAANTFVGGKVTVNGTYQPFVGDFDGDGIDDVFWYAPGSGTENIWYWRTTREYTSAADTVNGTYQPFVGDFDGDGIEDVYWYAPGPTPDHIWSGETNRSFTTNARNVSGTFTPLVGDFDRDAKDDIFWYGPGQPADYLWFSDGRGAFTSITEGLYQPYVLRVGDLDGDGWDDVFVYGPGSLPEYLLVGGARAKLARHAASPINGDYATSVGDLTSDGTDDILLYRPGEATDYIYQGNAKRVFSTVGVRIDGTYLPLTLNLNGTTGDDIVWYRPGSPYDAIWFAPTFG